MRQTFLSLLDIYKEWDLMKYYDDMYQNLKEVVSSRTIMGGHGRALCRKGDHIENSTCRVVVANPPSGFKILLQGM